MVGHKLDRINTVLSLLDWEKIDYIEKTDDPIQMIRNCLKPAQIESIELNERKAIVHINEDQKA